MKRISKAHLSVILTFSAAIFLVMCARKTTTPSTPVSDQQMSTMVSPPVIVYKTKADYSQYVPIILSPDKKEVVSFPAPGDVFYQGELAFPVSLGNGYYLDRRGINENAVYITLTLEAYSQLDQAPRPSELMDMILDMDPIVELYHCGSAHQYKDLEKELQQRAMHNNWQDCRQIK